MVSKLEFLKSLAIARVYGFKEYEKALQFIKLNYSVTLEGKEAERILNEVLPQIKNDEFKENKLSENYKIVYVFEKDENDKISQQLNDLQQYIDGVDFLDLRVSEDFYNNIVTFVVVHGLTSYDGGFGLSERLEKSINIQADSFFVISSENYKTIQIHKNLNNFITEQRKIIKFMVLITLFTNKKIKSNGAPRDVKGFVRRFMRTHGIDELKVYGRKSKGP